MSGGIVFLVFLFGRLVLYNEYFLKKKQNDSNIPNLPIII